MPQSGNFHPEWGCLAPAPNFMRTARIAVVATAIGATSGAAVVLSLIGRPASGPAAAEADKTLVVVHSLVQPVAASTLAAPNPSAAVAVTAAPTPVAKSVAAAKPPAVAKPTAVALPATIAEPETIAKPVNVAMPASRMPVNAQAKVETSNSPMAPSAETPPAPVASDAGTAATPQTPAGAAALAEMPPAGEATPVPMPDQPVIATDSAEPHKGFARKHHTADYETPRGESAAARKRVASKKQGLAPFLRHLFTSARNVISYNPN